MEVWSPHSERQVCQAQQEQVCQAPVCQAQQEHVCQAREEQVCQAQEEQACQTRGPIHLPRKMTMAMARATMTHSRRRWPSAFFFFFLEMGAFGAGRFGTFGGAVNLDNADKMM